MEDQEELPDPQQEDQPSKTMRLLTRLSAACLADSLLLGVASIFLLKYFRSQLTSGEPPFVDLFVRSGPYLMLAIIFLSVAFMLLELVRFATEFFAFCPALTLRSWITGGLLFLCRVFLLLVVFSVGIPETMRFQGAWGSLEARRLVAHIHTVQQQFKAACISDDDGDGQGDYGTAEELAAFPQSAHLIPKQALSSSQYNNYHYTLTAVPGSSATPPRYTCTADPGTYGNYYHHSYFVDQTGVIRYAVNGSLATGQSSPVQ